MAFEMPGELHYGSIAAVRTEKRLQMACATDVQHQNRRGQHWCTAEELTIDGSCMACSHHTQATDCAGTLVEAFDFVRYCEPGKYYDSYKIREAPSMHVAAGTPAPSGARTIPAAVHLAQILSTLYCSKIFLGTSPARQSRGRLRRAPSFSQLEYTSSSILANPSGGIWQLAFLKRCASE